MSNELLRLYFHRMRSKQSLLTDPYITHILLHQHRYNTLLFIFWKQQICVLKFQRSHCFLHKATMNDYCCGWFIVDLWRGRTLYLLVVNEVHESCWDQLFNLMCITIDCYEILCVLVAFIYLFLTIILLQHEMIMWGIMSHYMMKYQVLRVIHAFGRA